MIKQIKERGFTLIELLVVIAIIGILAAVVLASLNDARRSGNDAALKQSAASVRSQAEIWYNQSSTSPSSAQFSYENFCTSPSMSQLISSIDNNSGGSVTAANNCTANATQWALHAPLSTTGRSWCVDSTGVAREVASANVNATTVACPAS